jgi:signal transduction histidine kinase
MNPLLASGIAVAGSNRRLGSLRAALAGLTPKVVAIVAALLFIRTVSSTIDQVLFAANNHELGAWFFHLFEGYWALVLTAAPMLVIIIVTANLGPQQGPKRIAALTAAVILSAGTGALLRGMVFWDWPWWVGDQWDIAVDMLSYVWPRYAILGGMLTIVGEFYRREAASTEAMQRAKIDRVAFEREMTEARLQVLQAQVEPHFLYNTLANVRRLYEMDHAAGRTMLENLMRYLEVALPLMRHNESTLERDSELVEAFLRIQRIRMGQRLAFTMDIPMPLRAHHVPPMMLLTLVENAIKHGLNPSLDGGLIHVMARADGDLLILSVADTGVGFAPGSGAGTGLANVCARLAAQFGDRARLVLENNELGGATATIMLPLASVATAWGS